MPRQQSDFWPFDMEEDLDLYEMVGWDMPGIRKWMAPPKSSDSTSLANKYRRGGANVAR